MGAAAESAPLGPAAPRELDGDARVRDDLLIAMTFAAGVVDAVSYLGLGQIFTANMTGNVVFLALAVGQGNLATALRSVGALAGFCLGALLAGRVLERPRPSGVWPRRVTWLLFAELACMSAFAGTWLLVPSRPGVGALYPLIALSSFGMGFQNAAARHLAVAGLTTTVVTTAITGFMVDLPALGVSGSTQRRTGWAVVSIFSGAGIGAALMLRAPGFAPIVTVVTVTAVAALAARRFGKTAVTGS